MQFVEAFIMFMYDFFCFYLRSLSSQMYSFNNSNDEELQRNFCYLYTFNFIAELYLENVGAW